MDELKVGEESDFSFLLAPPNHDTQLLVLKGSCSSLSFFVMLTQERL